MLCSEYKYILYNEHVNEQSGAFQENAPARNVIAAIPK